jgi:fructose-specific PTS system IIA-like component
VAELDDVLDREHPLREPQPLLTPELVILHSDSRSKEEAVQEIIDALYVVGRCEDRAGFEEALWAREAVYSTGLGYGIATPHCKTDAVSCDSIAILRLRQPVEWSAVDQQPVRMVLLMAMSESDGTSRHMQVFSTIARKLMDEEFRHHLLTIPEAGTMLTYLAGQFGLAADPSVP